MSVKRIFIRTAANGSYTWSRPFRGVIHSIEVKKGDLSTPDIDVTDATYSKTFLSVDGVAADTVYYPSTAQMGAAGTALNASDESGVIVGSYGPAICMGVLTVAVTGAGDTKSGEVVILYS